MAKAMREVVVCDVCGAEDNVTAVAVAFDGEEQGADLCETHRQQLRQVVAAALGSAAPETAQGSGRRVAPSRSAGRRAAGKRASRKSGATASTPTSRMPRTTCPHCGMEMGVQNLSRHITANHPEAA
jgi:transcription elongation factor Elf1